MHARRDNGAALSTLRVKPDARATWKALAADRVLSRRALHALLRSSLSSKRTRLFDAPLLLFVVVDAVRHSHGDNLAERVEHAV